MSFLDQMRDLQKRVQAEPKLADLLDELERLEERVLDEESERLQLPYASPPKFPERCWKRGF